MKHMRMRRVACGELLTFAYLSASVSFATHTQCLGLESRTHGVELPEDFRSSFLSQRRVCEHGDVGTL